MGTMSIITDHSSIYAQHGLVRGGHPWSRTSTCGFTLPEVLIATIIAAAIAALTAQVMIGQLLEGRRLEQAQRIRENISRLNYLIQIEAAEAEEIEYGVTPNNCAAAGVNSFTLWVPRPVGQYADDSNRSGILYDNAAGNITRCGPPVARNGVLIHTVPNVTGPVVMNAQLVVNPRGCPASDAREVVYQVNFPGLNLGQLGGCTFAHSRSYFVCNPPTDPTLLLPTDCPP